MRNKKKWGLLLGVCSCLMVCSACLPLAKETSQNKEVITAETEEETTEAEPAAEEPAQPAEAPETEEKADQPAEKPETEEKASDGSTYERGILSENSYVSPFLGVRFDLPEGVILSTQEEADSLLQAGADVMYGEEDQGIIDYAMATVVCEMIAVSADQKSNVTVTVEKLPLKNMTEEQYLDAVNQQLQGANMTYEVIGDRETMTIAGQDFLMVTMETDYTGTKFVQQYAVRKKDDRMIIFVLTSNGAPQEALDLLISGFTPYE